MLHCYTGSLEFARRALDAELDVSFSGILTFKRDRGLREVAAALPLERLLVETDAPLLAPEGHRGRRNEPARVVDVGARARAAARAQRGRGGAHHDAQRARAVPVGSRVSEVARVRALAEQSRARGRGDPARPLRDRAGRAHEERVDRSRHRGRPRVRGADREHAAPRPPRGRDPRRGGQRRRPARRRVALGDRPARRHDELRARLPALLRVDRRAAARRAVRRRRVRPAARRAVRGHARRRRDLQRPRPARLGRARARPRAARDRLRLRRAQEHRRTTSTTSRRS